MSDDLPGDLPDDIEALKLLLAEREAAFARERAARIAAEAQAAGAAARIAHLELTIAKMKQDRFGQSSERAAHLIDQLEFELGELQSDYVEDELAAEGASAKADKIDVAGFSRRKPARAPLPAHLPRERVIIAAPEACPCCGSDNLSKLGEDVTETLEVVPRQWKVI